ncbi:MAG: AHH domain-containing protein [Cyanobacteriota bacterium]|nr:AHH domain-containing protein [Cyanobacteriota bacterium]
MKNDTYSLGINFEDNGHHQDQDRIKLTIESAGSFNPSTSDIAAQPALSPVELTITLGNLQTVDLPGFNNSVTIEAIDLGSYPDAATLNLLFNNHDPTGGSISSYSQLKPLSANLPMLELGQKYQFNLECRRLSYTSSSNSDQLARALEAVYGDMPCGTRPHYIVAATAGAAQEAQDILRDYGIGINSAENGVMLPANSEVAKRVPGAIHNGGHSGAYYSAVNDRLRITRDQAVTNSNNYQQIRGKIIDELRKIANDLVLGNLQL